MDEIFNIPRIAGLLAEPARASIVWALIDGTTRPAGELAFAASISPQSASAHLAKLVEGGLLFCEVQGRHRYFRIASADAAHLIESLASFGAANRPRQPRHPPPVRTMPHDFLHARTCYDHLAGEMAVMLLEMMLRSNWLTKEEHGYASTQIGVKKLVGLGIDIPVEQKGRRPFASSCVDLTQRRPHLSGVLGAALLEMYVREDWIVRSAGSRIVRVTPKGHGAFRKLLADEI